MKHLGTENTQYCLEIVSIRQKGSSGSRKTLRKVRKGKEPYHRNLTHYRCRGDRKVMPSHLYQWKGNCSYLHGRLKDGIKLEVEKEKAENSKQSS